MQRVASSGRERALDVRRPFAAGSNSFPAIVQILSKGMPQCGTHGRKVGCAGSRDKFVILNKTFRFSHEGCGGMLRTFIPPGSGAHA